MNDPVDLLQIKIEKAKGALSQDTRNAIDAVDWKEAIFALREKNGYSFEQLGELETETELLLSGLINPEDYPKELEIRMKIPKAEATELVNELNISIFGRIREEFIKIIEKKRGIEKNATEIKPSVTENIHPEIHKDEVAILKSAGIEINPPASSLISPFPELSSGKNESAPAPLKKPEALPVEPVIKITPEIAKIPAQEKSDLLEKKIQSEKIATSSMAEQKLSGSFQLPSSKTDYSVPSMTKEASSKSKIDPYREIPE